MKHEMFMMFGIACVYARHSDEPQADSDLVAMWERAYKFDEKYAKKFRRGLLRFLNIKGKFGKKVAKLLYRLAHSVVNFN